MAPARQAGKRMEHILNSFGFIASALAVGGMVFFSAVVAPAAFTKLEEEHAAKFIRGIFPWYYLYVMITAGVGALTMLTLVPWASAGLAVAAGGAFISRQGLMPRINGARDQAKAGDADAQERFDKLHKLSVQINGFGLAGALSAIVIIAINS